MKYKKYCTYFGVFLCTNSIHMMVANTYVNDMCMKYEETSQEYVLAILGYDPVCMAACSPACNKSHPDQITQSYPRSNPIQPISIGRPSQYGSTPPRCQVSGIRRQGQKQTQQTVPTPELS